MRKVVTKALDDRIKMKQTDEMTLDIEETLEGMNKIK